MRRDKNKSTLTLSGRYDEISSENRMTLCLIDKKLGQRFADLFDK